MADPMEKVWKCDGKAKYPTRAIARKKAHRASVRTGCRMGSYLCPHCKWWHFGNSNGDNDFHGGSLLGKRLAGVPRRRSRQGQDQASLLRESIEWEGEEPQEGT